MSAPLLPQHRALLEASAITPDVAAERGYYSETVKARLREMRLPPCPGLLIPVWTVDGRVAYHQLRPDEPRSDKNGKPRKYETPYGARNVLDVHPRSRAALGNPKAPLVITEGARKADAAVSVDLCAVSLTGVNNWRGRNEHGGLVVLPDFGDVALNGRRVYLGWDSDAWENPHVYDALEAFRDWLKTRNADVRILYLPASADGAKQGLDDYLAAGHRRDDLMALASTELRARPERRPASSAPKWTGPTPTTADVLERVRAFVARYVVMSDAQRDAVALWVAHTHAFGAAGSTPYLAINSAEPESGKTLLLEVLEVLVARPWLTGRVTAAALIRKVDRDRPTLLLDESDAAFKGVPEYGEALRGVLNTGYRASGRATLCVGQGADIDVRDFATFCPKAIAGLGRLPDTVASRSIPVVMQRRRADEPVTEWLSSAPPADADTARAKLAAWADANAKRLRTATPARPNGIGDRAYDVWRPLLAIAESAGDAKNADDHTWATRARNAAVVLNGKGEPGRAESYGVVLLGKLRALFADLEQLPTAEIVAKVNADDALPFGGWSDRAGQRQGIDARGVAKLLKPYGVKPAQIWAGDKPLKGYKSDDLADAFARYLPCLSDRSDRSTAQSQESGFSHPIETTLSIASEEAENGSGMRVLSDLSDTHGGKQAGEGGDDQLSMLNGQPANAIDPEVFGGAEGVPRRDGHEAES